jgi:hypothetical protein
MTTEAITKQIRVDANPETAFDVFTGRIGDWWPLEHYSVFGREATVAFEGDRIVERSPAVRKPSGARCSTSRSQAGCVSRGIRADRATRSRPRWR